MLGLEPVVHKLPTCIGFRLCYLVFMMREYVIDSARMYVEMFAKILHRHRRAFNMPAGPALSQAAFASASGASSPLRYSGYHSGAPANARSRCDPEPEPRRAR